MGPVDAEPGDASLVAAARAGDPEAFALLLERHAPTLNAVAYAVAGRRVEVEEVAAETAWRAWRGLGSLVRPERFAAWLRAIAANVAREALRQRERTPESLEGLTVEPSDARRLDPAAPRPAEDALEALREGLEALPDIYREALVLRHMEGMGYRRMAEVLGLTEAGVNQRLTRGRHMLADRLRGSRHGS
ncbi:MAG: RNA polymerase sigma factor [Planctomycetes bacterium]|nr:RNA polymerase sigma factor [Planctomycetota bacterium]